MAKGGMDNHMGSQFFGKSLRISFGAASLMAQFDFLANVDGCLFLGLKSSEMVDIVFVNEQGQPLKTDVFIKENQDFPSKNGQKHKFSKFLAVSPLDDTAGDAQVVLSFNNRAAKFQFAVPSAAAQLPELNEYLPLNIWPVLQALPMFSPPWLVILANAPKDAFVAADSGALDEAGTRLLDILRYIFSHGWQPDKHVQIYGPANGYVTVKRIGDATGQLPDFSLYALEGFKERELEFIRTGHVTGNAVEYLFAPGICPEVGMRAYMVRSGEDNEIAAFAISPCQPVIEAEYKLMLEKVDTDIMGWCVDLQQPDAIFSLEVLLDGAPYRAMVNDVPRADLASKGVSTGLGGFSMASPRQLLRPGKYALSFRLPNDEIAASDKFPFLTGSNDTEIALHDFSRCVNIIVPITEDTEYLEEFLHQLIKLTPDWASVILAVALNTQMSCACREFAAEHAMAITPVDAVDPLTLARLGMAAGVGDVLLLAPETPLVPRWLENMLVCAWSSPDIGAVCPLFIQIGDFPENKKDWRNFQVAARRQSQILYPNAPDVDFHYLLARREALESVLAAYEPVDENAEAWSAEFLPRMARAGWKIVLDDRTVVPVKSNIAPACAVTEAFSETCHMRASFGMDARLALAHNRVGVAAQNLESGRRLRVLFTLSTSTGGTIVSNEDMALGMARDADCYQINCDGQRMILSRWSKGKLAKLKEKILKMPVDRVSHVSPEYDSILAQWLFQYDIDIIHAQHLIWHSLNLPAVARKLGCRVVYLFHDYYAISPNLNLLDDCGVFLGSDFHDQSSPYRINMWRPPHPAECENFAIFWRERFQDCLAGADALVSFTRSGAELVSQWLPKLAGNKMVVMPHGRDFLEFLSLRASIDKGSPIRILVPGNISPAKGSLVLQNLAEFDAKNADIFEFHILGNTTLEENEKIICHGSYESGEMMAKVMEIAPHLAMIPSIWAETWCHTLTEMWACGLPVMAFKFGALEERIGRHGGGWLLDMGEIAEIYARMLEIIRDRQAQENADLEISRWQNGAGRSNTVAYMCGKYLRLYKELMKLN